MERTDFIKLFNSLCQLWSPSEIRGWLCSFPKLPHAFRSRYGRDPLSLLIIPSTHGATFAGDTPRLLNGLKYLTYA